MESSVVSLCLLPLHETVGIVTLTRRPTVDQRQFVYIVVSELLMESVVTQIVLEVVKKVLAMVN